MSSSLCACVSWPTEGPTVRCPPWVGSCGGKPQLSRCRGGHRWAGLGARHRCSPSARRAFPAASRSRPHAKRLLPWAKKAVDCKLLRSKGCFASYTAPTFPTTDSTNARWFPREGGDSIQLPGSVAYGCRLPQSCRTTLHTLHRRIQYHAPVPQSTTLRGA